MHLYICFCSLPKCTLTLCGVFLTGAIYDDLCKAIYFARTSDVELLEYKWILISLKTFNSF